MKVNDKYQDKFRQWIRDLKDAGFDRDGIRNEIEKRVCLDYLKGPLDGRLLAFGATTAAIGCGLAAGIKSNHNPFFYIGGALLGLWGGAIASIIAITSSVNYLEKRQEKRWSIIQKTAKYQRYCMGKGEYQRGASTKFNLDQL